MKSGLEPSNEITFIQKALWFAGGGLAALTLAIMTVLVLVYLNTH